MTRNKPATCAASALVLLVGCVPGAQVAGTWVRSDSSLEPQTSADLVIRWNIVDCSPLVEGQQPVVRLVPVLGSTTSEPLPDWVSAGSDLGPLRDAGACPAK